MNNKKKVINKLKGLNKYKLDWVDEVYKSIEVEATSMKEAKDLFFSGNLNFDKAEEGDINYADGSLVVEEVENDN